MAQQLGAFIAMVAGQNNGMNRAATAGSISTMTDDAADHAQRLSMAFERLPGDNVMELAEYAYRRGTGR